LRAGAALLGATGLLKIVSAMSGVRYLAEPDPVLSFATNGAVLMAAGAIEVIYFTLVTLKPGEWYSRTGLIALCATFVVYRLGLYSLGVRPPCPCLGRASDWLHLTPKQADWLACVVLVILLSIALGSILLHRRIERQAERHLRPPGRVLKVYAKQIPL
jgi:hypothetical protein